MKNSKIYWLYTIVILLSMYISSLYAVEMDKDVPIGWATVPKYGIENTIGGCNGEVVTVTSTAELKDYALRKEPYVIIANGSFSGMITVAANKTFIGAGSGARLNGGFFMWKEKQGNNVIIRNWEITGGNRGAPIPYMEDAVTICEVHHVWVDHNNLHSCHDGLVDVTQAADLVTISWNKLSKHNKVMLIQNGIERADEVDKLNTTIHHNYFAGGRSRNPRIGYADALILNNYYNGNGNYAIHLHWECRLHIEGNFFRNVGDKISQHKGGGKTAKLGMDWHGYATFKNNVPQSFSVKEQSDPAKIFDVDKIHMYDFIVDDVNSVPQIVESGSSTGEQWSKLGPIPTPGQGLVNTFKNPMLKWTKYGSKPTSTVYFGKTQDPPEVAKVEGYEYQPGMLEANTVYYWRINEGKLWKFRTGSEVDPKVQITNLKRMAKKESSIKPFIANSGAGVMLYNPTASKLAFTVFTLKGQVALPLTEIEAGKRFRLPLVSTPLYIKVRGPNVRTDGYLYMPLN